MDWYLGAASGSGVILVIGTFLHYVRNHRFGKPEIVFACIGGVLLLAPIARTLYVSWEKKEIRFEAIVEDLQSGRPVQVPGFGTFSIVELAERKGVNPATGEPIIIPARKDIRFKPAKELTDAVLRAPSEQ